MSSRATGTSAPDPGASEARPARVGLLGGTFNPPHLAHLICAQEALVQLELDRVVLIPVSAPPHKQAHDDPGAAHRLEMCRRAVGGDGRLAVSALEIERGGRSYTLDTLRAIHLSAPRDELTLIVGGDMAASFESWHEPEEILALASLGVAERGEDRAAAIDAVLGRLRGGDRWRLVDMPRLDISSTAIRARVRADRPIRYLVPDAVVSYIGAEGLYRA